MSEVRHRELKTGTQSETGVDSVFVAIGREPNAAIFKEQIERHPNAYIKVAPGTTQASVLGVLAS